MIGILFKLLAIGFALVMSAFALANVLRSNRRLNSGIERFKAEQAELEKSGRARDPYGSLAEIIDERKRK